MPNNQYRPPERHEIAGIQYISEAFKYNWLGIHMCDRNRAIALLLERASPSLLSPMFDLDVGAVLQQADRYAETKCAKDRDVLRELAIDLVAKAAG
ncbi:hypothetical protein ACPTFP_21180 [Pseudomonas aeruginosa]|uniref:hypothetical protein n=1 Tax=Pseudomonas aeruginosa TaxID=287 RepID=UPI0004522236|nr:hypothetical protein [Pseudomonas aeruginosa]ELQ7357398.1 hypothetical protein [Pseudomonas aeruginosa]ETV05590.1 hypothetical protein Q051_01433 [Pseudomonas aeruginosa BWHPSA046]KAJ09091.1 hypothetical protein M003_18050 [Pseudomonas aeruginosa IGB83]MBG5852594.1 hypothetical protein [Pseudomonas aeruginosa]MBG6739879.1 hypothetical protein [Pseudomonas aeruginosa]